MTAEHAVARAAEKPSVRNPSLDGLRAIAVLLVFLDHTGAGVFRGGWTGVDVFFVISGFLITSLLIGETQATGRISLRNFYVRRFLRLLPALVVMLIVVAPIDIAVEHSSAMFSVSSLFYFSDFWFAWHPGPTLLSHTWSLGIEEQFYLVWPLLLIACLRDTRRFWPLAVALLIFSAVGTKLGFSHVGVTGTYYLPTTSLPMLSVGAALAFSFQQGIPGWAKRFLASPWVPGMSLLLTIGATVSFYRYMEWPFEGPVFLLALAPAAVIGHTFVVPNGACSKILGSRALVWFGQRSYGFYLWHAPISFYLFFHGYRPWQIALITFPSALVLTVLSYDLVERRFNLIKDRVFGAKRAALAAGVIPIEQTAVNAIAESDGATESQIVTS